MRSTSKDATQVYPEDEQGRRGEVDKVDKEEHRCPISV